MLRKINNTFERVPNLCGLDLSYNNFKFIDHNWKNWSALSHGANLQGNPIECTCGSQWLTDYFVPLLYANPNNHQYLNDLRCASPERFKNHRLVEYLNHSEPFCRPEVKWIVYDFRYFMANFFIKTDTPSSLWALSTTLSRWRLWVTLESGIWSLDYSFAYSYHHFNLI